MPHAVLSSVAKSHSPKTPITAHNALFLLTFSLLCCQQSLRRLNQGVQYKGWEMKKDILICDGAAMIHELLAGYFRPLGFSTRHVHSQPAFLEALNQSLPDIILLDSHVYDADVLVEEVRNRGFHMPILLMGSATELCSQEEARAFGANGLLEKPFRLKNLLEMVMSAIASQPAQASAHLVR